MSANVPVNATLSAKDRVALRWAAKQADSWYGGITGDPDAERAHIKAMDAVEVALLKLGIVLKRRNR